jgi:hypothetical protein
VSRRAPRWFRHAAARGRRLLEIAGNRTAALRNQGCVLSPELLTYPQRRQALQNDPPCGTERCYNGLRLASVLAKVSPEAEVTVFLMADAVLCAKKGQKTPDGYDNLEGMLGVVLAYRLEGRVESLDYHVCQWRPSALFRRARASGSPRRA